MAPTRPSIMSDGATTWAPASACDDRGSHQPLDRRIVEDALAVEHAAVAVLGVLAQADVGDDDQIGHLGDHGAHRARHRALRVPGRRSLGVLGARAGRTAARAPTPSARAALASSHGFVDRELEDARHRRHGAAHAAALARRTADRRAGRARGASRARARGGAAVRRRRRGRSARAPWLISCPREVLDERLDERRARCIRSARSSSVMPSCCAASAVTGPIEATTVPDRRSGACSSPSALTKWRTEEALVKVTASTCRSSSSL